MIEGYLAITGAIDSQGERISTRRAFDRGWLKLHGPKIVAPTAWNFNEKTDIPLGPNMFTDQGRQVLVYAFGFRSPIINYVCTQFGIGTGTTPAKVTDTVLESPLTFYDSNADLTADSQLKPLSRVSFSVPFHIDFELTLGTTEANGYLITELGLFTGTDGSGGNTLVARKITTGVSKSNSIAPIFTWRMRI